MNKTQTENRSDYALPFIKFLVLFLGFIGIVFSVKGQNTPVILEAAELHISGTTNVSQYNCKLIKHNLNETVASSPSKAPSNELFHGLKLQFFVSDFACNLRMITHDFRTALKEDVYPLLYLQIHDVLHQIDDKGQKKLNASIQIQIAGESRPENIRDVELVQKGNVYSLRGSHTTRMTHFGIVPPTKMFGSVRTNDTIEISFLIDLKHD